MPSLLSERGSLVVLQFFAFSTTLKFGPEFVKRLGLKISLLLLFMRNQELRTDGNFSEQKGVQRKTDMINTLEVTR
jgi:hypothetical protein